jgi:hypothetical protein
MTFSYSIGEDNLITITDESLGVAAISQPYNPNTSRAWQNATEAQAWAEDTILALLANREANVVIEEPVAEVIIEDAVIVEEAPAEVPPAV